MLGMSQPGNPGHKEASRTSPKPPGWDGPYPQRTRHRVLLMEVGRLGQLSRTHLSLQVMGAYYASVAAPGSCGAAFLAVCRGKVRLRVWVPHSLPVSAPLPAPLPPAPWGLTPWTWGWCCGRGRPVPSLQLHIQ